MGEASRATAPVATRRDGDQRRTAIVHRPARAAEDCSQLVCGSSMAVASASAFTRRGPIRGAQDPVQPHATVCNDLSVAVAYLWRGFPGRGPRQRPGLRGAAMSRQAGWPLLAASRPTWGRCRRQHHLRRRAPVGCGVIESHNLSAPPVGRGLRSYRLVAGPAPPARSARRTDIFPAGVAAATYPSRPPTCRPPGLPADDMREAPELGMAGVTRWAQIERALPRRAGPSP